MVTYGWKKWPYDRVDISTTPWKMDIISNREWSNKNSSYTEDNEQKQRVERWCEHILEKGNECS